MASTNATTTPIPSGDSQWPTWTQADFQDKDLPKFNRWWAFVGSQLRSLGNQITSISAPAAPAVPATSTTTVISTSSTFSFQPQYPPA